MAILGMGGAHISTWGGQVQPNFCVNVTTNSEQNCLVAIMGVRSFV